MNRRTKGCELIKCDDNCDKCPYEFEEDGRSEIEKEKDEPIRRLCGNCKWLNLKDHSCIGYLCEHPNRPFSFVDAEHIYRWGYSIAARKYTSTTACKRWEHE